MLFVVVAVAVAVVVVVVAEGGERFPHSIYNNSRSTAPAAAMLLFIFFSGFSLPPFSKLTLKLTLILTLIT